MKENIKSHVREKNCQHIIIMIGVELKIYFIDSTFRRENVNFLAQKKKNEKEKEKNISINEAKKDRIVQT